MDPKELAEAEARYNARQAALAQARISGGSADINHFQQHPHGSSFGSGGGGHIVARGSIAQHGQSPNLHGLPHTNITIFEPPRSDQHPGPPPPPEIQETKKQRDKRNLDNPNVILATFYYRKFLKIFGPWRRFFAFFGFWPITYKTEEDHLKSFESYKLTFYYDSSSCAAKYFKAILGLNTILCLFQWINLVCLITNLPPVESDKNPKVRIQFKTMEKVFLYHYYFPIARVILGTTFITLCQWKLYFNRVALAELYNYTQLLVEQLKIDVLPYINHHMWNSIGLYMGLSIFLALASLPSIFPYLSSQPSMYAILLLRVGHGRIYMDPPTPKGTDYFYLFRLAFFPTFLFNLIAQDLPLTMYIFHLRIFNVIGSIFNARLYEVLNPLSGTSSVIKNNEKMKQAAYDKIYSHFMMMLDLTNGIGNVFEGILYSFFFLTGWMLLIESYYFIKGIGSATEFHGGSRTLDIYILLISLPQKIWLTWTVLRLSSKVYEDYILHVYTDGSRKGFERKGGKREIERQFAVKLAGHFQSHFLQTLGTRKLFSMKKSAIVGYFGILFMYGLILSQFNPEVDYGSRLGVIFTTNASRQRMFERIEGNFITKAWWPEKFIKYPYGTGKIRHCLHDDCNKVTLDDHFEKP